MAESYSVPVGPAEVTLRFKNSRFIGVAGPAPDVEAAKAFVGAARARFPDASHHCYAYAVGHGATVLHGMSDDGEPSGTAGRPMLAVVQGAGVGDLVVVAVRYFGGTKLGTGGLVKAYTETAQTAVVALTTEAKVDRIAARLILPYDLHGSCCQVLARWEVAVEAEDFADQVRLSVSLAAEDLQQLQRELADATSGRVCLELDEWTEDTRDEGER